MAFFSQYHNIMHLHYKHLKPYPLVHFPSIIKIVRHILSFTCAFLLYTVKLMSQDGTRITQVVYILCMHKDQVTQIVRVKVGLFNSTVV